MADDFSALKDMVYSGRGIIVGTTSSGIHFVGYTLTGRSPSSQARELIQGKNTGVIRTSLIGDDERLLRMFKLQSTGELSKLKEDLKQGSPALIYYPAIVPLPKGGLGVSNGAQTRLLYDIALQQIDGLRPEPLIKRAFSDPVHDYDAQQDRWIDITSYEPDAPNNTPRISACLRGSEAAFHIVRKFSDVGRDDVNIHEVGLSCGKGKLLTTYSGGNEKPLKPFTGAPLDLGITSQHHQDIAESLYDAIYGGQNPEDNYRVAVAVAMLSPGGLETTIINRVDRGS